MVQILKLLLKYEYDLWPKHNLQQNETLTKGMKNQHVHSFWISQTRHSYRCVTIRSFIPNFDFISTDHKYHQGIIQKIFQLLPLVIKTHMLRSKKPFATCIKFYSLLLSKFFKIFHVNYYFINKCVSIFYTKEL